MSRRMIAASSLLMCAVLAGCGGQHRQPRHTTAGTPATDAQVLMLARVLESDFVHGGAQFTASLNVNGQPVQATGRVDFVSGRGTALVSPVNSGLGPPRQFYWTRTKVLAQAAPGSRRYVSEVPNEQGNPIHGMIGFINLLSSETIDNTANISAQGPLFLGHTTIAGARRTNSATAATPRCGSSREVDSSGRSTPPGLPAGSPSTSSRTNRSRSSCRVAEPGGPGWLLGGRFTPTG